MWSLQHCMFYQDGKKGKAGELFKIKYIVKRGPIKA
jgi:hypothetical protein